MPQRPQQLTTTVQQIQQIASNVKQIELRLPESLSFQAGQFVIVNVPHQGKTVKRAYSIASPPYEQDHVELCIQIQEGGIASTFFDQATSGDEVSISGPHGTFMLTPPVDFDPIFLAVGTGIAPLRSMYRELFHHGTNRHVWLFLGVRYDTDVLYHEESLALAKQHENFTYLPTVSRPKTWTGEKGYVQQQFQQHITDWTNRQIYICGWTDRVKMIAKDLASFGIPQEQVHYEEWG